MKSQRVSLDDIAKSIGVSKAVVSLVMNGKSERYGISESTRLRVLNKADELNYRPNQLARGLRLGYTNTIGLIVSDISNSFYAAMARHFEDLAAAAGFNVIICSTDEDIDKELKLLKLLRNRQVDGIILSSSQENPDGLVEYVNEGFPLVLVDRYFDSAALPAVVVDNFTGGKLLAKHLADSGFTRPLVLTLSPSHISTVKNRVDGFSNQWTELGITPEVVEIPFDDIFNSVGNFFAKRVGASSLPDSLFAVNNNLATATMQACNTYGLSIPADIALVCFDDLPYFEFIKPSVTSIKQPIAAICNVGFELLMQQINRQGNVKTNELMVLPIDLVIRESSKNV